MVTVLLCDLEQQRIWNAELWFRRHSRFEIQVYTLTVVVRVEVAAVHVVTVNSCPGPILLPLQEGMRATALRTRAVARPVSRDPGRLPGTGGGPGSAPTTGGGCQMPAPVYSRHNVYARICYV